MLLLIQKKSLLSVKSVQKRFSQKNHLNVHEFIHATEKPFILETCTKKLSRRSHLKQHLLTHEKEKPFTCQICSKGFYGTIQLKISYYYSHYRKTLCL